MKVRVEKQMGESKETHTTSHVAGAKRKETEKELRSWLYFF